MPRIRTVKPELFRHEGLFDAEKETGLPLRIAFIGLFTAVDREGRFRWRPRTLKVECLPYDDVDFSRVLDALETRGFIVKYASEDEVLGFIPSWHEHQVINNKESASKLAVPNKQSILTRDARVDDASGTRGRFPLDRHEGKGKEGKGMEDASGKST